jgi:hypothetical protein
MWDQCLHWINSPPVVHMFVMTAVCLLAHLCQTNFRLQTPGTARDESVRWSLSLGGPQTGQGSVETVLHTSSGGALLLAVQAQRVPESSVESTLFHSIILLLQPCLIDLFVDPALPHRYLCWSNRFLTPSPFSLLVLTSSRRSASDCWL